MHRTRRLRKSRSLEWDAFCAVLAGYDAARRDCRTRHEDYGLRPDGPEGEHRYQDYLAAAGVRAEWGRWRDWYNARYTAPRRVLARRWRRARHQRPPLPYGP